jgi:hypothetical protein
MKGREGGGEGEEEKGREGGEGDEGRERKKTRRRRRYNSVTSFKFPNLYTWINMKFVNIFCFVK